MADNENSKTKTTENLIENTSKDDLSNEDTLCDKEPRSAEPPKTKSEPNLSSEINYELIDNVYYYTDKSTDTRYMYDSKQGSWIEHSGSSSANKSSEVTVDDEGRQFYWADGMYLCKDTQGYTYYMDENSEWQSWVETITEEDKPSPNRWYYHKADGTFYRDNSSNKVYKLNKLTNEWEEYKRKRKKRKINDDEEFDTDDEEQDVSSEEEEPDDNGAAPPGSKTDPSIKFDGKTYTKHDPSDNMNYEWDPSKKAWFPLLDDDFMATYQLSYGFNPDGTKNDNPLKFDDGEEDFEEEEEKERKKKKAKEEKPKPGWFDVDDAHNTKVYVSNLPLNMDEDAFVEFMSKCGLVYKDPETQKFKVKLYNDPEGNFKGDALCTYIKIESVVLALQILDGYNLDNRTVKVERAKFTLKGEYNPTLKPKKKKKKTVDRIQKKQEKLLDWHPDPMRGQRKKHENVVIFRNVFDPAEFDVAAERILTHKENIRVQAVTFGSVKKVELFDRHPEGVLKITFEEVESADMCVATLNDRLYQNRKLVVGTWDGSTKYDVEETEEQREERLRKWNDFLEGKSK